VSPPPPRSSPSSPPTNVARARNEIGHGERSSRGNAGAEMRAACDLVLQREKEQEREQEGEKEKEREREREGEREREENNKFDGNSFPVRATPAAIRLPRVARAGGQITRRERMEGANFHRPAKSARFFPSTFAFGGIISVRDSERLSVARAKYILISVTFPALIGRWGFPGDDIRKVENSRGSRFAIGGVARIVARPSGDFYGILAGDGID